MKFIADLHIHSHYSRATSKQLTPVYLDYWAKIKGVNIVGTGDFTHPGWTEELKQYLEPAEEGLFKLKNEFILENPVKNPPQVRFLLSAEISNIYKKNGKVRKIHNVVLAPDIETAEKIQKKLSDRKFNITSDGRPILGMDARDLLEMLLEIDQRIFFFPAHIWTPWFAVLGSKSGFDSIEECFEDMTQYIYAAETGLSSDQPMNWICSFLDKFTMVSNSDAHSPEKLGRNANIFNTELSYYSIIEALKHQERNDFIGTIDLYPQEGKYHYDGHRKCGVRFDPVQTMEHEGICPVCGKPLTLGVAHRVASLADRDDPIQRPLKKEFNYIIPLKEILSEINRVGAASKKIENLYLHIVSKIGNESYTLLEADYQEIKKHGGELLAEAIRRMRSGEVIIEEGYDGEYGVIKLFENDEINKLGNKALFDIEEKKHDYSQRPLLNFDVKRFRQLKNKIQHNKKNEKKEFTNIAINEEQEKAIKHEKGHALIIAGPGTGKTYTLTQRIAYLIKNRKIDPESILAITFTNQAANEMKKRLVNLIGKMAQNINITTFHAFGLNLLKQKYPDKEFIIINDEDKKNILSLLGIKQQNIGKILHEISLIKNLINKEVYKEIINIFDKYNAYLEKNNLLDYDDLIYKNLELLKEEDFLISYSEQYKHILIDEFQDINPAQYDLIRLLVHNKLTNIFAIGDPNQSIYGFRGADKELINRFIEEYNPTVYNIHISYRVPQNILDASLSILSSQQSLRGLNKGIKIKISNHPSDKSEAEYIAREIEKLIGGLRFFSIDSNVTESTNEAQVHSLADIAILVRTQHQFPVIIKALNDHSIPYQIIGEKPFYKQEPISQIIDILDYLLNPNNQFLKVKIQDYIAKIQEIEFKDNPVYLIHKIAEKIGKEIPQLDRLIEIARKFNNTKQFLLHIKLSDIQDDYIKENESIALMTIHASKGLEFDCVFIPGLEDGLIPYTIYKANTNIEEEERLLYVGMTRSKRWLYLSYAKNRFLINKQWRLQPSRFLDRIKKDLLDLQKNQYKGKPKDNQLKLF